MAHFVCTGGCNGVSEAPGVCNINSCMKEHQPLTICNCKDGQHKEVFDQLAITPTDSEQK